MTFFMIENDSPKNTVLLGELCQSFPSISWLTFEIIEVYGGFFSFFKK